MRQRVGPVTGVFETQGTFFFTCPGISITEPGNALFSEIYIVISN